MSNPLTEAVNSTIEKKDAAPKAQEPIVDPSQSAANVTAVPANTGVKVLYGDKAVCEALRIRRRVIAAARTKKSRGVDWDVIDLHAGMTKEWVEKKALELHVVPKFDRLIPIKPGDGVVSVALSAVVTNIKRAVAEVVATGERIPVWVDDNTLMCRGEIFDCLKLGEGNFTQTRELNSIAY